MNLQNNDVQCMKDGLSLMMYERGFMNEIEGMNVIYTLGLHPWA